MVEPESLSVCVSVEHAPHSRRKSQRVRAARGARGAHHEPPRNARLVERVAAYERHGCVRTHEADRTVLRVGTPHRHGPLRDRGLGVLFLCVLYVTARRRQQCERAAHEHEDKRRHERECKDEPDDRGCVDIKRAEEHARLEKHPPSGAVQNGGSTSTSPELLPCTGPVGAPMCVDPRSEKG